MSMFCSSLYTQCKQITNTKHMYSACHINPIPSSAIPSPRFFIPQQRLPLPDDLALINTIPSLNLQNTSLISNKSNKPTPNPSN